MGYKQYDCLVYNTNIMNKNMHGKTYREGIPSEQSYPLFQCGCGEKFHTKSDFKEHSIRIHNAQHILHSTHFLTPFTFIVIPTNQHQKITQVPLSQQSVLNLTMEKTPPKDIFTAIQPSRVDNTHSPSSNRQKSIKDNQKMAKSEMIVQPSPKEDKEEEIEWNGFRLCRNPMVESDHFYCGKCMLDFLLPEQFIVHCLQVCQRLKYMKSSHFILCDIPQEKTRQINEKVIQSYQGNQETKKQEASCEIYVHSTIKDLIGNEIMELFTKYSAKTEGIFICGGCNKAFPKSVGYYLHIRKIHSEMVPPNSSHIMLRTAKFTHNHQQIYCYVPQIVSERDNEEKYYCCCNPETKTTLKKLIKHIIEVHKGISPLYGRQDISSQQAQKLPKTNKRAQQAPTEITKILDPIFSINSNMDHKKPPFTCHSCDIQFIYPAGYTTHFHNQINKCHHHLGSHIVLRIQSKPQRKKWPFRCLYISALEEWPIKQPIYYCPCTPERVTMQGLIEHVTIAHNCISPVYKAPLH